jgi:protein involved in polysaccharide export with SLBB domain
MRRTHLAPAAAALLALLAACGTGTQQRILTRPNEYNKIIAYGQNMEPVDIEELVRMYPALDGRIITAAQYIEEYDRRVQEALAEGRPPIEWTVSPGTSLNIVMPDSGAQTYYVGPNGYVDLPFIGPVRMSGRTLEDIKEEIRSKLARYYVRPEVRINVVSAPQTFAAGFGPGGPSYVTTGGDQIVVMGVSQTRLIQNIPFTGNQTLVGVLGIAGLPPEAEWRAIRVIRRSDVDPLRQGRIIICDLWSYFAEGDVRQDIPLFPGDVVFVPRRWNVGEQFEHDWDLILKYISGIFTLNQFRLAFKEKHGDADGQFRK